MSCQPVIPKDIEEAFKILDLDKQRLERELTQLQATSDSLRAQISGINWTIDRFKAACERAIARNSLAPENPSKA